MHHYGAPKGPSTSCMTSPCHISQHNDFASKHSSTLSCKIRQLLLSEHRCIKRTDYKQHVRCLIVTELEVYVTKMYFVNFKINTSMIASSRLILILNTALRTVDSNKLRIHQLASKIFWWIIFGRFIKNYALSNEPKKISDKTPPLMTVLNMALFL